MIPPALQPLVSIPAQPDGTVIVLKNPFAMSRFFKRDIIAQLTVLSILRTHFNILEKRNA
jgi:hypothetical protein